MGYMTTDFWANYNQIWLEPMYILVTAWNDKAAGWSIGCATTAGKPEWTDLQHRAAERLLQPVLAGLLRRGAGRHGVDDSTPRRAQLFDDHLVMHPGPNRFASIAPGSLSLPSVEDISDAILNLAPSIAAYLAKGAAALPDDRRQLEDG